MASSDWTDAQRAAIAAAGGLTVAAGAGAGKTSVLTERVVHLLRRFDSGRLLVVTFTEAAAAEMKSRIALRLAEATDPRLRRQALRLPQAQISTLHAFCLTLVRRYGSRLGVPPGVVVTDAADAGVLLGEAIDAALADGGDALCAAYGERVVAEAVRAVHGLARSLPDPEGWLAAAAAGYGAGDPSTFAAAFLHRARADLRRAAARLRQAEAAAPAAYRAALAADAAAVGAIAAEAWDPLVDALAGLTFGKLPPSRDPARQEAQRLRGLAKRVIDALRAGPLGRALSEHANELRDLAPLATELADLVRGADQRYRAAKDRRGAVDFADLEHLALALLRRPDVRPEYDAALIDEYQDTSPIQDAILGRIVSEDAQFVVGDVLQSIYGFRLAAPENFLRRLQSGSVVHLAENFRSRRAVLAAVNALMGQVLPSLQQPLPYVPLVPAARYEGPDPDVEVHVLAAGARRDETEAAFVAGRVASLLRETGQAPGDVALLLRSAGARGAAYAEALRAAGVPVQLDAAATPAGPELRTMHALLATLDNPRDDIALAATLRSPLVGLRADDLAAAAAAAPKSPSFADACRAHARRDPTLAAAWARVDGWRDLARRGPLADALAAILRQTAYLDHAAALPDGAHREAGLRALLQRAAAFDRDGAPGGIRRFLDLEAQRDLGTAPAPGAADAVHLTTIHRAKGLEFPVVILAGCGSPWNREDTARPVAAHRALGFGLAVADRDLGIRFPSLALAACRAQGFGAAVAEEARLLYVALTRARERLLIVGSVPDLQRACTGWVTGAAAGAEAAFGGAGCALDWIGVALARLGAGESIRAAAGADCPRIAAEAPISVRLWAEPPALAEAAPAAGQALPAQALGRLEPVGDVPADGGLVARLRWRYPHPAAAELPAKVSVTDLEGPRDLFVEDEGPQSSAAAGSAAHVLLRHLDLGGPPAGEQLQSLVAREVLTAEQAALVDVAAVELWRGGELATRLRGAELLREAPFYLRRPAGPDGEWQLVQGVVDLLAIESSGRVLLVDFKTGRPAEAHRTQVAVYAEAVGAALGRAVDEAYLCYLGPEGDQRVI